MFGFDKGDNSLFYRDLKIFYIQYQKVLNAAILNVKSSRLDAIKPLVEVGVTNASVLLFQVLFKMFNSGEKIPYTSSCGLVGRKVIKLFMVMTYKKFDKKSRPRWDDFVSDFVKNLYQDCNSESTMAVDIGLLMFEAALDSGDFVTRISIQEEKGVTSV